jgi:SAM-dependent methyltransferase
MAKKAEPKTDAVRKLNALIAASYDTVVYDPEAFPDLHPSKLRTIAALFGLNCNPRDVLDLACGTGAQLAQIAQQSDGRVVGIDISSRACELATERFVRLGRPAEIQCLDILDADLEALGQFDLITCIGALYVVPDEVRARMIEIVGRLLRPGGLAVLSYYSGLSGLVTVQTQQIVKASGEASNNDADWMAHARRTIAQVYEAANSSGAPPQVTRVLHNMTEYPDSIVFHETLGPDLKYLSALEIQAQLAPHGVGVIGPLPCDQAFSYPSARHRAVSLDAQRMMGGGYYYDAFGKWASGEQGIDPQAPGVEWISVLEPNPDGGEEEFRWTTSGLTATVGAAGTRAFLKALGAEAKPWAQAKAEAQAAIGSDIDETVLLGDTLHLWRMGGLEPRLAGLPAQP